MFTLFRIREIMLSLFLVSLVCSPSYAQEILVYASDLKQKIDMVGGDMERSSKAVQSTCTNTSDVIQWGFGDINFNYCRVEFDKNQELTEGVYNWAFYEKQITTMQQIKAVSPDIKFYATMRSDYDGYGNENNMPDWIVNYTTKSVDTDKYAIFLADYLEYMDEQGVPIHTLATAKEWGAFVTATTSRDIITKLKQECTDRNIDMPLINDPGAWSMSSCLSFMNSVENLGTKDLYAGFSSHEYASNDTPEEDWPVLVAKAESLGKKLYQDETIPGVSNTGEVPVYRYAQRAVLYQSGLSGEVFFEIWSRGLNNEIRSIYWQSGGEASRLNGYYVMKHFANNVLDSYYITTQANDVIGGEYSATAYGGVTKMAFRKDNVVMLWVMNLSSATLSTVDYPAMTIKVNSPIISSIQRVYWNTGSAIEGSTEFLSSSSSYSFQADIKENSLNVFTFYVEDNSSAIEEEKNKADDFFITLSSDKNTLTLSQPAISYGIVNLSGVVVKKENLTTNVVDISNLSQGVYILQAVNSDNQLRTRKFVVQ